MHIILGAGQVGPLVAKQLVARGEQVRIGRSTARNPGEISLDVRDADAVARLADGAEVVYHCVNPVYTEWNELLLPITRGIVEGTRRAGARLVALDNLYMYGDTSHMREDSPLTPCSRKGELRVRAAEVMLEAGAAIGRAADFFGPSPLAAIFGARFYERVLAGKRAEVFGDPDMPHSYSYTPDVAAGLVQLGLHADARGVWMLPVQPAEPTRQVIGRFARAMNRDIGVMSVPNWMLRAVGVFSPLIREVAEMTYQWRQPYAVDDSKFRARFGVAPTPWDDAVAASVAWGVRTYGQRLAA